MRRAYAAHQTVHAVLPGVAIRCFHTKALR
jgi:hypothetical protein